MIYKLREHKQAPTTEKRRVGGFTNKRRPNLPNIAFTYSTIRAHGQIKKHCGIDIFTLKPPNIYIFFWCLIKIAPSSYNVTYALAK